MSKVRLGCGTRVVDLKAGAVLWDGAGRPFEHWSVVWTATKHRGFVGEDPGLVWGIQVNNTVWSPSIFYASEQTGLAALAAERAAIEAAKAPKEQA